MTFPPSARNYLIKALAGTPDILKRLLKDLAPGDPRWDANPDPIRFSLREITAHLADWEEIWLGRFKRVQYESRPFLPSIDEGQLAIANDYKHCDPLASIAKFCAGRAELVQFLDGLEIPDWDRTCEREFVGPLTVQMMASYVLSHDGYHLHQVVEWLTTP